MIKLHSTEEAYCVCAWCGKHISGELTKNCVFTHGICEVCEEKLRREEKMKRKDNIGTVSEGTMRPEDLIPKFLDHLELQEEISRGHRDLITEMRVRQQDSDYFDTEHSNYDLEELFDALNEYAPEDYYFGAHPGDGACYGYWRVEDGEV